MSDAILDMPALRKLSGKSRAGAVRRWLESNRIPYLVQNRRAFSTTLEAVNRALYAAASPDQLNAATPRWTPPPPRRSRKASAPSTAGTTLSAGSAGTR